MLFEERPDGNAGMDFSATLKNDQLNQLPEQLAEG